MTNRPERGGIVAWRGREKAQHKSERQLWQEPEADREDRLDG